MQDHHQVTAALLALLVAGPALAAPARDAGKKATQKGIVRINRLLCDGCQLCPEVCKMRAMVEAGT